MKVLIVGKGAREHAMAWACARDPEVEHVWVAPGNPGTAAEPGVDNLQDAGDPQTLGRLALDRGVDLVLVGPEQPIADGWGDQLRQMGLNCLAPSASAARLEASKSFAKDFMRARDIPTADYGVFTNPDGAIRWAEQRGGAVAVKADGLAAGKGVVLARNPAEVRQAVRLLRDRDRFGSAGDTLVVEELLEGREVSFTLLSDGERALALATSEDHKARDDGDTGPNTGGMGAVSPSPAIDAALHRQILDRIALPTIEGMAEQGSPFVGFLYLGLMIDRHRRPRVLEFNCRLGDPEAQVLLYRQGAGFAGLCAAAAAGELPPDVADPGSDPAVCVVMAAAGYPDSPRDGDAISGLEQLPEDVKVFHGGTARDRDGQLRTAGGRVLSVTASAADPAGARARAYAGVQAIEWDGAFWRTDIGARP